MRLLGVRVLVRLMECDVVRGHSVEECDAQGEDEGVVITYMRVIVRQRNIRELL